MILFQNRKLLENSVKLQKSKQKFIAAFDEKYFKTLIRVRVRVRVPNREDRISHFWEGQKFNLILIQSTID